MRRWDTLGLLLRELQKSYKPPIRGRTFIIIKIILFEYWEPFKKWYPYDDDDDDEGLGG